MKSAGTERPRITVEFFGIPRERSGVPAVEIEAGQLGEALSEVGRRLPALEGECLESGRLLPGFLVSLNAREFTTDPTTPLRDGDCVLILSADAGG